MRIAARQLTLLALLLLSTVGCGGTSTPASPSPAVPSAPTGPRILLAGQSGAYFLAPHLPGAIDLSNIDGSVDFWLASPDFANAARTPGLAALVWFQGGRDIFMPPDTYASKLRATIQIARSTHSMLPVLIVEIPDPFDTRTAIKAAQREVAADPGNQWIPTDDLPLDDTSHLTPTANQTLRDRIYRAIGR